MEENENKHPSSESDSSSDDGINSCRKRREKSSSSAAERSDLDTPKEEKQDGGIGRKLRTKNEVEKSL